MENRIQQYAAEHRYLLDMLRRELGFADPIALDLDEFQLPLVKAAKRREVRPIEGVLIRDWDPDSRQTNPGVHIGLRVYDIEGVCFVRVSFHSNTTLNVWGMDFVACDRCNYARLYRIALRCRRDSEPASVPPVLPPDQLDLLWKNTIGYLEGKNLEKIRAYGGRAKRGLLLTGAPGNGKTMACRWIWEACRERHWEYRLITPDNYRSARSRDCVEELFSVDRRGIIFFDDMDQALRDREKIAETEDQAVFLSAMDGIHVNEGVVFVFTTNCGLELIDRAFKRPGRLDVVLHFNPPNGQLRRQLIERWHNDIRTHLDIDEAVRSTDGYSFAEVEELRNLLVMNFMETARWDWTWALKQFNINRQELSTPTPRQVGFGL